MQINQLTRDSENLFGEVKSIIQRSICARDDLTSWKKGEMSEPGTEIFSNYNKKFNKKGFITDFYVYQSEKMIWKQKNNFNSNNQLIDSTRYLENGDIMSKTIFAYDSNNLLTESNYYFKGSLYDSFMHKHKSIYKHDNEGVLLEEKVIYDGPSSSNFVRIYEYEKDGSFDIVIRKSIRSDGSFKDMFADKYDTNGNKVMSEYKNPESYSIVNYKYDRFGNVIEKKHDKLEPSNYLYTLDHKNNWVEKRVLSSNQLQHIIKREIEYW